MIAGSLNYHSVKITTSLGLDQLFKDCRIDKGMDVTVGIVITKCKNHPGIVTVKVTSEFLDITYERLSREVITYQRNMDRKRRD